MLENYGEMRKTYKGINLSRADKFNFWNGLDVGTYQLPNRSQMSKNNPVFVQRIVFLSQQLPFDDPVPAIV